MPKAVPKLAAAPSLPPASISKTPMPVHNSFILTTSLPIGSTAPRVTVPDMEDPKREQQRQILLTHSFNQQNSEVRKFAS